MTTRKTKTARGPRTKPAPPRSQKPAKTKMGKTGAPAKSTKRGKGGVSRKATVGEWRAQGYVSDALGRRVRAERARLERLKALRRPMREMGEHPAVAALGEIVRARGRQLRLSLRGLAELSALSRPTVTGMIAGGKGGTFNSFAWLCWGMNIRFAEVGRALDRWLGQEAQARRP